MNLKPRQKKDEHLNIFGSFSISELFQLQHVTSASSHPVLPWSFGVLSPVRLQTLAEDLAGILHSSSIQIRRGRGSSGAGVGHRVGARFRDVDLWTGDPQNSTGNLSQERLPEIRNHPKAKGTWGNFKLKSWWFELPAPSWCGDLVPFLSLRGSTAQSHQCRCESEPQPEEADKHYCQMLKLIL